MKPSVTPSVTEELRAATAEADFYAEIWQRSPGDRKLMRQYYESLKRQCRAIDDFCAEDAPQFINRPRTAEDIEAMRLRFLRK